MRKLDSLKRQIDEVIARAAEADLPANVVVVEAPDGTLYDSAMNPTTREEVEARTEANEKAFTKAGRRPVPRVRITLTA
jgi:hypothetical protein